MAKADFGPSMPATAGRNSTPAPRRSQLAGFAPAIGLTALLAGGVCWSVSAAEPGPPAAAAFAARIRPILVEHCLECHSGEKPKGDLNLDKLPGDVSDSAAGKTWGQVLERIRAGEMPPEEKPRLTEAESKQLGDWIGTGLAAAAAERGLAKAGSYCGGSTGWNTKTRSAICWRSTAI